ncbi:serine/threonine protein kinase [Streptomyces sp. PvR006]|uniref:protein kinase domain-containing protein n=1 Tax=Streptomyces sp. PvR006 TaxID=2817860 RepID=UPI001AE49462|nr:protein kinase [Streptomyces sp. PvR006]MBP2584905.1 serine/threonine protein kinase [Streptomyces sp. PvR006]
MSSTAHHIGPDSAPDRYRLLRSIGRGGEAVLYLAEIELAGSTEPVVVKILDAKTTLTPEVFERISQKWNEQAELLRFVHRPGVVGVREHFQGPPIHRPGESGTISGRALALVMNHVEGLDLRDWRAERTLATAAERREVMRTLEQLADVLDWLHSGKATPSGRTVVHGDLSPGNVMVDEHGQATLVDFGLSKLTADHQTAEVWFTPGYAAPEVFEGKRTPGTDRYAFGAIAYFLLSGQSPPTAPEQLVAALGALPQVAGLPAEQRDRVLSLASADPGRRPLSLSAWVKDVRHGVVSTTTSRPATVADAVPPAAPPRKPSAPPLPMAPPPPAAAPAAAAQPPVAPQPSAAPPGFGPAVTPPAAAPQPVGPPPVAAAQPAAPQPGLPQPSAEPPTVATPGFGPPTPPPASSAAETAPPRAPEPRRRRKGPLIGAVAGVLVVAVLAVIGVRLLGDKEDKGSEGKGGTTVTTSASPASDPTTEAPTDEPTEEPTEEPTVSEEPSTGTPGEETTDPAASESPTGDPGSVPDSKEADLTGLAPIDGLGGFSVTSAATLNARDYGSAFTAGCSNESYMEFNLGRKWKSLEFTAGIDDDSPTEEARITISVDDRTASFSQTVQLGKPVVKSIPITGALRLRIRVEDTCSYSQDAYVIIAAPLLKR